MMEYLILAGAMVIFVVLVMGKEYLNNRKCRKKILDKLYQSYGTPTERSYKPGEMDHIMMYYHKHPVTHQIDDITWNDLNMDQIYQTINTSCSAAGDEYLYYRLRTPVYDAGEMEELESEIQFFVEHEKERHDVQDAFYTLGRTGKYSIYEYLEYLDDLGERRNFKYVFFDLLLFVCIGLMFLSPVYGIVLLLVVLCHNIIVYFKEYKQIEPYITSFRYIRRLLECVEQIQKLSLAAFSGEQEKLVRCYQSMKNFRRSSYLVLSSTKGNSNPLEIVLDYLRMCFSLDLIQFNKALRAVRGHIDEIDEMITLIGQMETAVVIGSYRRDVVFRLFIMKSRPKKS